MKKFITVIFVLFALAFLNARSSYAQNIAERSAYLKGDEADYGFDFRVANLKKFFIKYNSPLADYAKEFVECADENNLDYRLIPAITGVESTFGKHIPVGSYNAYGWANGDYSFASWEDSISHVSEVIKEKYIDKGALSIKQIARIYAPPSSTWGKGVTFFVGKIDTLPLDFDII